MCARISICKTALRPLPLPSVNAVAAHLSAGWEASSSRRTSQGIIVTSGMGWKYYTVPSQKAATPATLDGTTAIVLGLTGGFFSPIYYNVISTLLLPTSVSALVGLPANNVSIFSPCFLIFLDFFLIIILGIFLGEDLFCQSVIHISDIFFDNENK